MTKAKEVRSTFGTEREEFNKNMDLAFLLAHIHTRRHTYLCVYADKIVINISTCSFTSALVTYIWPRDGELNEWGCNRI